MRFTSVLWRNLIICAIFLIICTPVFSYQSSDNDIQAQIERLIQKTNIDKAHLALKIIALPEEKTIYESSSNDPMIVASNTKLFSTATALCELGSDFKFITTLFYDGKIKGGSLSGNLVIKSNGDPNISGRFYNNNPTAVFEKWADALKDKGIKSINGDIVLDDSAFDRQFLVPYWPKDQLSYWYCAPISAISFNDNCILLTVSVNSKGKISYSLSPPTNYVKIKLDVSIDRKISSNQVSFQRIAGTNDIVVRGKLSPKGGAASDYVTISNPPLFFGMVLAETLARKGITLNGKIICVNDPYKTKKSLVKVSEVRTGLLQTIDVINKNSQNFYAEQVLKSMAYHRSGKGSYKEGAGIVSDFLTEEVGIKPGTFAIYDGCGLSRENRFSVNHIIDLLTYMYSHKNFLYYRDSLNINKWNVRKSNPVIWAKSGYLNNALAVSGYAVRKGSHNSYYAFSLVINDYQRVRNGFTNAKVFRNDFIKLLQEQ